MSLLTRLFAPTRPAVALEIGSSRVTALRLGAGNPPVATYAVEPLAPGAVVPSLVTPNLVDEPSVAAAVARALESVGSPRHVALVVPDSVAKVSLVRFDQVPARPQDLEAMLRWQMRKSVPFRVDEAQMTWSPGQPLEGGAGEFIVAIARREIVGQYEAAVAAAGAHAGLVDLATFNLANLVLTRDAAEDWLLVHMAAEYVTLGIVRRGRLIFFRHRGADGDESLEDLVHQTAMYYEDRLSGHGFGRVFLAGAAEGPDGPTGAERVRRTLAERLHAKVDGINFGTAAAFADRITASPALVDQLAPLVGILSREPAA